MLNIIDIEKKSRGLFIVIFILSSSFLYAQNGGIVLSFDDHHNIANWVEAIPLFQKYNARATFFIDRADELNQNDFNNLKKLSAAGFAIGTHGINHRKSVDYVIKNGVDSFLEKEILPGQQILENNGLCSRSFAYPSSQRSDETDTVLQTLFPHVRTGEPIAEGKTLAEMDQFFTPVNEVTKRFLIVGKGCDNSSESTLKKDIFPALERAKEKKEILTLYAHNIANNSKTHYIKPEILEEILKEADRLGLNFYTFDDLALWKDPETTRIVSFNVRGCRGFDEKVGLNPSLAGDQLKRLNPDFAGLQEIDQKNGRSEMTDQIGILGSITDMKPYFAKSIDFMGGEYGIGALTVKEPIKCSRIPLPGKEEARALLELEFDKIVFFNTHLSLTPESREGGARIIKSEAEKYSKPVILVGDLNISDPQEWTKLFGADWTILSPEQFTFPADNPNERIDYIMVYDPTGSIPVNSPEWKKRIKNSGVINVQASDHRPVFVDIQL